MAKFIRYKDGTKIMEGTTAWELHHHPPRVVKRPNAPMWLELHMEKLDEKWRSMEGRKPISELTEREKMLEGRIPWNPALLKQPA